MAETFRHPHSPHPVSSHSRGLFSTITIIVLAFAHARDGFFFFMVACLRSAFVCLCLCGGDSACCFVFMVYGLYLLTGESVLSEFGGVGSGSGSGMAVV